MGNRIVICPICGKEFEAKTANAKYCSIACRQKGKYRQRKEWELQSGYLEKQRQAMQEYRNKIAAEKKADQEAKAKQEAKQKKQRENKQHKKEQKRLLTAAEKGDPLSRLLLAAQESGNKSPEYWEAYKEYDISCAEKIGNKSTTTVNGISVYNPDFGLSVSISIEELGCVEIAKGE